MNLLPGTAQINTGNNVTAIGNSGKPIRVFSVEVISNSTGGATFQLFNGTAATGLAYIQVDGVTSKAVDKSFAGGVRFPNGCFASVLTANFTSATIVFTEEF